MVVDDEDRENEGDLIFAAELATPELVAFMVRYTSGYICVPITEAEANRLDLPPMFHTNQDKRGTAYTVTVDAREGVSTGISATDRAQTIRLLASPTTTRPTWPDPGTSCRFGPRTAAFCVDLGTPRPRSISRAWPACSRPACCARSSARRTRPAWPGSMNCGVFADEHGLAMISIADLIAYRRRFEKLVERVARPGCLCVTASSPRTVTPRPTTSVSMSRSSSATSVTARTCWYGCTRSA